MSRLTKQKGSSDSRFSLVFIIKFVCLCMLMLPVSAQAVGNLRFSHFDSKDGLSQNTVSAIQQDDRGYLWLATQDGLNRYDGLKFKVYRPEKDDPRSLSDGFITTLFEDSQKRLWIGTRSGLNRYLPKADRFVRYGTGPEANGGLSHAQIESLFEDSEGTLWVGTFNGLNRYDPEADRFVQVSLQNETFFWSERQPQVRSLARGPRGKLWFTTPDGVFRLVDPSSGRVETPLVNSNRPQWAGYEATKLLLSRDRQKMWIATVGLGVLRLDIRTYRVVQISPEIDQQELSHSSATALYEDAEGRLWVGTQHGLNIESPGSSLVQHFHASAQNPYSLSHDHVTAIYPDRSGVLWVGTLLGGLNKHVIAQEVYSHFYAGSHATAALSSNSMRAFYPSPDGALWVGTDNGLNRLNAQRDKVDVYLHRPGDHDSLSGNRIWALLGDGAGSLWVGTATGGLNRLQVDSGKITRYLHDKSNPGSLASNKIRSLYIDSRKRLWVGSWGGGLSYYDSATDRFVTYRHDPTDGHSLSDDRVTAVREDANGRLWVGTQGGLNLFDPEQGRFVRYLHADDKPDSLVDDRISSIRIDPRNRIWIGTRKGLDRLEPESGLISHYGKDQGLLNEVVYALEIDNNEAVWVSTNKGLFRLDRDDDKFTQYTEADGLQADEFNTRASARSAAGELFFGGINGFNAFFPEKIRPNLVAPQIVLNDFRLFNKSVALQAEDEQSPLAVHIDQAEELTLNYKQSMLSFEFAALHYVDPASNRYHYRLEGFDQEWIETTADRPFAAYTNLDAGEYQFRLRAENKDGAQQERSVRLSLNVLPPPWKSWWAYLLYFLALAAVVVGYIVYQQRKLARERKINQQLRELDKLKDEFLANTSHELRTPLNGIIGLAESMLGRDMPATFTTNLEMIASSGRRLNDLVDNILNFSKLNAGKVELHMAPVELDRLVEQVMVITTPLLGEKPINLVSDVEKGLPLASADESRLHQIMLNLVVNAIKFTREGEVRISARREGEKIRISVSDTGIGIDPANHELIFKEFQQVDGSTAREFGGTGLGLALSQQLAKMHQSKIEVDSGLGQGSEFSFVLDAVDRPDAAEVVQLEERRKQAKPTPSRTLQSVKPRVEVGGVEAAVRKAKGLLSEKGNVETLDPNKHFTILIVDDDTVNRHVLKSYLEDYNFRLLEASGGEEALRIAQEEKHIDLILLDIMMPVMSGYEVCEALRKHSPVNDLPILFLTAKTQVKDIVDGFIVGGNDYLTKPVAKYELQSRVQTHLQLLDINRELEAKVRQRTLELEEMNQALQLANLRLEDVSMTDQLTGLHNRRYFMRRIEADVKAIDQHFTAMLKAEFEPREPNHDMVFYMIDLDHFKQVNDTYGHAAGDAILKQIKDVLQQALREDDYVVRWGGEEFLIIARNTERSYAPQIAERMRRKVEEAEFVISEDGQVLRKTCSIGFAAYPFYIEAPQMLNWSQVVDMADRALYAAKDNSRNAWVGLNRHPKRQATLSFEELTADLAKVIEANELEVFSSIAQHQPLRWQTKN